MYFSVLSVYDACKYDTTTTTNNNNVQLQSTAPHNRGCSVLF